MEKDAGSHTGELRGRRVEEKTRRSDADVEVLLQSNKI